MAKKTMAFQAAAFMTTALVGAGMALAQAAAGPTATIHGHVNNPAGMAIKGVTVQLSKDHAGELKDRKWAYKFTTDDNGDFKGTVEAGDYFADVTEGGKNLDYLESFKVAAGADATLTFDMSRKEYIDKMSPEDKAALEEYKKRTGEAMATNKVIGSLNATLKTVREDLAAKSADKGDVSKDVSDMQSAVQAKPDEGLLWMTLGDTLQAQADHLAKDDRAAGKPPVSDDAVQKNYSDAVDAYKKGVELSAASKKPVPADQAIAYNQMGNSLAKAGKVQDASAAFETAVKLDPTKGGMYYGNEAAVLFNAGQTDAAAAAADKAIAVDPNRPDPYFIKGQALIAKSTFDAKTSKLTAPPGCVEAYQKYLELAPDGRNAQAVKDVLTSLGEKINTKYSAGKKK